MTPNDPDIDVTSMLQRANAGESSASAALLPLVYDELRGLARHFLGGLQGSHTLQPTAVVHEAYVKLLCGATPAWESRAHFFSVAARAMRQILTDHAKGRNAAKRGGDRERIALSGLKTPTEEQPYDLEKLDLALTKLAALDPQQARVVECRFLVGMTVEEIAHVLGVSTRSVERDWAAAKLWLKRELT
jgi:RNA polymerase sigma factor (TIGR02999 family)